MTVERKLLDFDPLTGIREEYLYDHADDVARLEQTQDMKPVLEAASDLRKNAVGWGGEFVSVAKLSMVQCIELMKIGIMDRGFAIRDEAAFNVWLSLNSKLKTTPGRF
jgi:hypothetical protein